MQHCEHAYHWSSKKTGYNGLAITITRTKCGDQCSSCSDSQGKSQTGLTVAPYFIVINFHVSQFGLTVVPAACIVIGLHASPTVGCVKRVTTVIKVLTPPSLTCGNQPNYGFNMAAAIAFQAIFDSCVPFWIFILTFTRSLYCLSF